jgi:O-antigen/teichoic acid export membrane protein
VSDLKKKFLSQFLLALTQLVFPLITYPYLARTLGPVGIGKVSYAEFVAGLIITVFSIGIPYYGIREIAKVRNDRIKRSQLTSELIFIHLLCTVAGMVIFAALLILNPNYHGERSLIVLGSLYILFQVFTIEWYLQGVEAFQFIAWRTIVIRLAGIAAIFLFVKNDKDYVIYYSIILATQLFVGAAAIAKMTRENQLSFRSLELRQHLRPLFYFFLTSSFISIYVFFDTIILGWLAGREDVGYYTFSLRIIKLPLLLLLTLNTILYPRISYLHVAGEKEKIFTLGKFTTAFIITLTIPISVCFFVLAPEIISLLGGEGFLPSIRILQILAPLPLLIGLSNFLVLQVLAPSHKERSIMIAVLIASIISLTLNFLLIPRLFGEGAAIAVLVTEASVFLLSFYFSYRQTRQQFSGANLFISLGLSAFAFPIVWLLRSSLNSPFYILSLSLIIFGLLYFALQYFLFGNEVMKAIVNFIVAPLAGRSKQFPDAKRI